MSRAHAKEMGALSKQRSINPRPGNESFVRTTKNRAWLMCPTRCVSWRGRLHKTAGHDTHLAVHISHARFYVIRTILSFPGRGLIKRCSFKAPTPFACALDIHYARGLKVLAGPFPRPVWITESAAGVNTEVPLQVNPD